MYIYYIVESQIYTHLPVLLLLLLDEDVAEAEEKIAVYSPALARKASSLSLVRSLCTVVIQYQYHVTMSA